jgi:signal transduction histidine kinase
LVVTRDSSKPRSKTPLANDAIPEEDLARQLVEARAAAKRTSAWIERLERVSSRLSSAPTVSAVAEVVVSEGIAAFGPDNGGLWLLDPTRTRLDLYRSRGLAPELQERFSSYPLISDNPLCHAVRTGEAVWIEHWEEFAARFPSSEAGMREVPRPADMAFACLPLQVEGQTIGGLSFTFYKTRSFPADERSFVSLLARECARGIERARLYDQALQAVRVRDDFLAVAGHELRTPLAALVLQAETVLWMADNTPPAEVKERAAAVLKSVGRLVRLVDELLDTSRITTGRLMLRLENVELVALVKEVVARTSSAGRRATAGVHVQSEGPVEGRWDRARLEQVVTNLLTNALKYGRSGPVDVRIGRSPDGATLSVRDYGIGIEPADQRRIFERFERGASVQQYGGLGLGLWITREIVEAHRGRITVSSTPGEGATFTVTLPYAPL